MMQFRQRRPGGKVTRDRLRTITHQARERDGSETCRARLQQVTT